MASAARLVAFEGMVSLQHWEDTSSNGPKVRFGLLDRDALAPFEKATKRRGKKAGQRYLLMIADRTGEPIAGGPDECFLVGASWAHTVGASVVLAFASIDWWRGCSTSDGDGAGDEFHITLVELQSDETPIDQVSADAVEHANKPKGGPKSKHVAQVNQSSDFQHFVGYVTEMPPDRWHLVGADTCDRWVKQVCGVQSKIEFDHNPEAWARYEKLVRRRFITWARAHFGESYGL